MVDSTQVLRVLEDAHRFVWRHWGTSNPNVPLADACGSQCASVAIYCAAGVNEDLAVLAHMAFLQGAGIEIDPTSSPQKQVQEFNDSQANRKPVLAAFEWAISHLRTRDHIFQTPNADTALEIMAACDAAGKVVAQSIVRHRTDLDLTETARLVSAELFYAAQGCAYAPEAIQA